MREKTQCRAAVVPEINCPQGLAGQQSGVTTTTNKYRADIDGLRAIAVAQVVFFHAGFTFSKSGFVGVDIFFVISGFLITGILHNMREKGSLNLLKFYERRIRRILPVLFITILISIPFSFFLMLPDDLENFGQSQIASAFSANNVLLWLTENYFSVRNEFKPLVHTWSLGIEEQFYFFYPIIFIVTYKLRKRISMLSTFSILWLISFSAASWFSHLSYADPHGRSNLSVAAFYLLPTRAFELLTGAITLLLIAKIDAKNLELWKYSKIVGLFLILCSGFLLPLDVNYPNYLTLIPLIGTVLFLISEKDRFATPLITNRYLVRIGLASYSIYLFHQPIFAFYRLAKFTPPSSIEFLTLILITVILGLLSHSFLERPFRLQSYSFKKVISILSIMVFLIVASGSTFVMKSGYLKGAKFFPMQADLHRGLNAEFNLKPFSFKTSSFRDNSKLHLLVIGNSQARDFINALSTTAQYSHFEIVYRDDFLGCLNEIAYRESISKLLRQSDYVIFGSSPSEACWEGFRNDWNNRVNGIFVLGEKNFGTNVNAVMVTKVDSKFLVKVRSDVLQQNIHSKQVFKSNFVDMNSVIGPDMSEVPILDDSGFLISQDGTHLTPSGAKFVGDALINSENFPFMTLVG